MKELQQILKLLDPHAGVIDAESFNELRAQGEEFRKNLASVRHEGRNLRIAVIGQMKAGKSSFLNAALFDKDVLPKAETPMTATLTSIVHGSSLRADVMFYSREDWRGIEQGALAYEDAYRREEERLRQEADLGPFGAAAAGPSAAAPSRGEIERAIDPSLRACAELVAKAHEHGLDPADYLGKTKVIEGVDDPVQLAAALHDYVGSAGRFTAITKMSTLQLNDPRLEGLEIVDTPGFNDPVVSRGAMTRAHLARCDVIFFLSKVDQFLSAADMKVFREQLPEAGLGDKAVFLVGTQRDIALRQDAGIVRKAALMAERYPAERRENAALNAMLQLLDRKLGGFAEEAFAGQAQGAGNDERTRRLLEELRRRPPHFISAWASLVAGRHARLPSDDAIQLERLERCIGMPAGPDRLRYLSNIPPLLAEILAQGERKRELLAGKEQALEASLQAATRRRLEQIRSGLAQERAQIAQGSIAQLERQEREAVTRLEKGRLKLEDVFDEQAVAASRQFALLKGEIKKLSRGFTQLETVKGSKRESYKVDVSFFGGFFGPTWETRHRDVATVHAEVQDAVEKIDRFAHECVDRFQGRIGDCIDLDSLRKKLGSAAMDLFDTGSADFDGELMLNGINKSLRRLTIPSVDFSGTDFTAQITAKFGTGRVDDGGIEELRQAHRAAIEGVVAEIGALVDRKVEEIETSLARSAKSFVTDMSRDIAAGLRKLQEQRAGREEALAQIDAAAKAVSRCLEAA